MSIINNDNFDRDTKLDPATLNTKFTDVTSGTTSIDETNVRNSGIDNPQIAATSLINGRNGFQLYLMESANCGSSGGTAISDVAFNTALPNTMDLDSGNNITLAEGDIIRAYWFADCAKTWTIAGAVSTETHCWAQSLQWDLNSAGFVDVPGQGAFNTAVFGAYNGIDVDDCNACNFIHHASFIDRGTAAENEAPIDAAVGGLSYLINDIGTGFRLMATGSWVHRITAGEAGTPTITFRIVMNGLFVPIYDAASTSNYLVYPAVSSTFTPILHIYDCKLAVMIMKEK